MNTSGRTYKELAIPHFKEVFDIIDEVMLHHKIIGVNAIALELLKNGIKPGRGTKDIDFAVMISSITLFESLSKSMIKKEFNKVKAPWTFYSEKYNIAIDLLPFGEIEEKDTIRFNERYSDLHILGFKEILENPEKVLIEEKLVNIPPLEGMIILKLVAWSDRPEERDNDLTDILLVIEHYFDHQFDEIVEFYHDTFPEKGFDPLIIAAEVLGRKARHYLDKSEVLSQKIISLLEENTTNDKNSLIATAWASEKGWQVNYALSILKAFQKGIIKSGN